MTRVATPLINSLASVVAVMSTSLQTDQDSYSSFDASGIHTWKDLYREIASQWRPMRLPWVMELSRCSLACTARLGSGDSAPSTRPIVCFP
ncbi:hypothetical protein F5Y15DRAFT_61555 [Xylariaceae sp. FL0016]|nr:hypothetical protein F5Y15DRAFT_61555 [Xylariaceae sp. FL0016]